MAGGGVILLGATLVPLFFLMDRIEGLHSLPQHSVDMLLTDPPYGTTRNYWDVALPLPELWEAVRWLIKPDGAVLIFAQCPYDKVLGASNLAMPRYEWVWYKERGTGFLNANRAPLKKSENILVFYRKAPVYHPQFSFGKPYLKSHRTAAQARITAVLSEAAPSPQTGGAIRATCCSFRRYPAVSTPRKSRWSYVNISSRPTPTKAR